MYAVSRLQIQLGKAFLGFNGILTGKTGQTEAVFWLASGLDHPGKAQVA